jgi:hypothetical protein
MFLPMAIANVLAVIPVITRTGIITTDNIFTICLRFPASVIGFPLTNKREIKQHEEESNRFSYKKC